MKYYQNEEKSEMNILVYGRKEKTNDIKVIKRTAFLISLIILSDLSTNNFA
jgi:hypothetical protein